MICMSLDTTLMFCSACLYVSVRRKTGSDCECVEAYQRILETTGGKKPWQEAASRGQQWDWGGNGARSGGRNVRWWRNFHLCSLILHQQMIYFSPCRSLCPWESPPPPSSPLQTGLYLDTHQGIWHHVFFPQACDSYLQVERLSKCLLLPDYQRWEMDMAARRWSGTLGGLWVTDLLSLTADNWCFSQGLISGYMGQLQGLLFISLSEFGLQRTCCFLLLTNLLIVKVQIRRGSELASTIWHQPECWKQGNGNFLIMILMVKLSIGQ